MECLCQFVPGLKLGQILVNRSEDDLYQTNGSKKNSSDNQRNCQLAVDDYLECLNSDSL